MLDPTTQPKLHFKLLPWFKENGRHDLPWQIERSPYTVWISEIMLQQTQVNTVISYYLQFINTFPTLKILAQSNQESILAHWSGLGYYARARNLHRTAKIIQSEHNGILPNTQVDLNRLPGIGRSTAAAILSQGYGQAAAILDGNVKRVLCRYYGITHPPKAVEKTLWSLSEYNLSLEHPADYTQAIMDLGATICTKHAIKCAQCPLSEDCIAYKNKQTDQIPAKIPRKTLETQIRYFAVILNQDRHFFLIKRPETGIWGGLWSYPESSKKTDLYNSLSNLAFPVRTHAVLAIRKHRFTHFQLEIRPILFTTKSQAIAHTTQIWHDSKQTMTHGLAKPVRDIFSDALEKL